MTEGGNAATIRIIRPLVLKDDCTRFARRCAAWDGSLMRYDQVEYALEAVKQGSASVGLRSKTHVVLLALKVRPLWLPLLRHRSLRR